MARLLSEARVLRPASAHGGQLGRAVACSEQLPLFTRNPEDFHALEDLVVIRSVQPGGPAEKAGMKQLDVVVEIGGKTTPSVPQLLARIAELPPGSTAKVKIVRAGNDVEVAVLVGKRPPPERQ
jgi:S1-C subfamily serine protease